MKIIILILIGIAFLLFVIDYLTAKDIKDIDDETYYHQYITALNEAVDYYEKQLGRRLTENEYNKLKYKISNDFYGLNR